jgi:hypothetical protein
MRIVNLGQGGSHGGFKKINFGFAGDQYVNGFGWSG